MSLHSAITVSSGCGAQSRKLVLTSLLFDKLSYFVSMMDAAIVKNKHTSRTWVRICEGYLSKIGQLVD